MPKKFIERIIDYINDTNEFWFIESRKSLLISMLFIFQGAWAIFFENNVFQAIEFFTPNSPLIYFQYVYNPITHMLSMIAILITLLMRLKKILHYINHVLLFFITLLGIILLRSDMDFFGLFAGIHLSYAALVFLYLNDENIRKLIINVFEERGTRKGDKVHEHE